MNSNHYAQPARAFLALISLIACFSGYATLAKEVNANPEPSNPEKINDIYSLKIDAKAQRRLCRSIPFLVADPTDRGSTKRQAAEGKEVIPVGSKAETLFLLGLINQGADQGVTHWSEHPEMRPIRDDQICIGARLGDLRIRYADGTEDLVPLVIGATAWYGEQWESIVASKGNPALFSEPFASRPELGQKLLQSLKLQQTDQQTPAPLPYARYYLALRPRPLPIESLVVTDNPALRGFPLISAVTLRTSQQEAYLEKMGPIAVAPADARPVMNSQSPGDWSKELDELSRALYTGDEDLPRKVKRLDFPPTLDAATIRFLGDWRADMLSNVWVANLEQIDRKFERKTGMFRETEFGSPTYGGYNGFGAWAPGGGYAAFAYARTSDHYVTLALRALHDPERTTHFVDYVDYWLYFYRNNHDPAQGPPNDNLHVERYPADAPPHWAMVVNGQFTGREFINELPGDEEMEGHGATLVARWQAWRLSGATADPWLKAPRDNVFGKSRWDSTRDAAEFICWLMAYTGRDVIYSESEPTCYGGGDAYHYRLLPKGMDQPKDEAARRHNYANADMYEPYASFTCLTGLRCAAQMADRVGETALARRWRDHADRIEQAMIRLLTNGDHNKPTWRTAPLSIMPNQQESLVAAWFGMYLNGLDPARWNPELEQITRNTLERNLHYASADTPLLGMGYGLGWLTHAALIMDDMDAAARLLPHIATYSYDKNMNYVDQERGIDWTRWLYIIPEGVNLLPTGRWHRIGDLSNGANQGACLQAMALCAGLDDSDAADLKIMPRVPDSLNGIEISNWRVMLPAGDSLAEARLDYQYIPGKVFKLHSNRPLPLFSIRLGPFKGIKAAESALGQVKTSLNCQTRVANSGQFGQGVASWIWFEGIRNTAEVELKFQ